jgi:lipopolysaccharide biosynthesis regulator YciM
MRQTKTDAEMEQTQAKFGADPERAHMLECARRFKASWVELGEALTEVRRSARWRDWGFESIEEYAKKELRLRPETVEKLTGSYQFLAKRAPALLDKNSFDQNIPSYQAIDFLRRAEERTDAPQEVVRELYNKVVDENMSLPKLKRVFEAEVFPISKAAKREREAAGLRNVGGRLLALVQESEGVPERLKGRVSEVLEELLATVREEAA